MGLACQWVLKPFFPLPLVTQVAWQDLEERAEEKTELVIDKTIRGGKSLSGVFGERIVVSSGWSIPGAWPSAEGTRSRDFRASCRYERLMGNPSMSRETSLWSGLILTGR